MTNFDDFGTNYKDILNKEIYFFGEDIAYFAEYKARCVVEYLGKDFKGKILDYGCGIGLISKYLYERFNKDGIEIVGYDIAKELLREADKNVKGVRFFHSIRDIKQNDFDVVIMANVLHHIKIDDRRSFVKNVVEILKKGGHLVIFEHNPYNPLTRFIVNRSVLDKDAILLSICKTEKLLREAGMKRARRRYIVFFPRALSFLRFLEPLLGRFLIGAQYYYIGEK